MLTAAEVKVTAANLMLTVAEVMLTVSSGENSLVPFAWQTPL